MRLSLFFLISVVSFDLRAELVQPDVIKPHIQSNIAAQAIAESDKLDFESKRQESTIMARLNSVASQTVKTFSQIGTASWYGRQFHGRKTASGETFNMNALTAAHPSLPLNCLVKVTNPSNGKSVVVKINDRGPFTSSRAIDLSYEAAKRIGIVNIGTAKVVIERIS